jgi:serine/threonine-protein kinase
MKKFLLLVLLLSTTYINGQIVSTLAGSTTHGSADGIGSAAGFWNPSGVTADTIGNLYVTDGLNNEIRKIIISTGQVTTMAGSTASGSADGIGALARFNQPLGITYDGAGNLYVADPINNEIRKIIISTGQVTTIAGSTTSGSANGTDTAAKFNLPSGVACDGNGNLFVADHNNNMIRKIVISTGVVSTLAGSTTQGFANGIGTAAKFYFPIGLVCDGNGNLFVTDNYNYMIRKIIISSGLVSTLAGYTTQSTPIDGTGTAAGFGDPNGIIYDGNGNLFVTEASFNKIRKIVISSAVVTTIAGTGTHGSTDGIGTAASFNAPKGITCDKNGNLYIADGINDEIRMITNTPMGIEKVKDITNEIVVYPNPAQNNLIIETNSSEKQSLQIFDVNGNLILSQSINDKTNVDASSLNTGVYNISIIGSEGVTNKRLVIIR